MCGSFCSRENSRDTVPTLLHSQCWLINAKKKPLRHQMPQSTIHVFFAKVVVLWCFILEPPPYHLTGPPGGKSGILSRILAAWAASDSPVTSATSFVWIAVRKQPWHFGTLPTRQLARTDMQISRACFCFPQQVATLSTG